MSILSTRHVQFFSLIATKINSRKSRGMSKENIKNPPTSDNSFAPNWIKDYPISKIKFNAKFLRSFIFKNMFFMFKNIFYS